MTTEKRKKKGKPSGPGLLHSRPVVGHIGYPNRDSAGSNALATMGLLREALPGAETSRGGLPLEGNAGLVGQLKYSTTNTGDAPKDYMFGILPIEILEQILEILYSEHEADISHTRILHNHSSPPSRFNYPIRALKYLSSTSRTARRIVSPYVFRFAKLQTNHAGLLPFFTKISFLISSPVVRRCLRHVQVYNVCTRSQACRSDCICIHGRVCRSASRHLDNKEFLSVTRLFWQVYRKQLTHLSFYFFCRYGQNGHDGIRSLCGLSLFETLLDDYDFTVLTAMGSFELHLNRATEYTEHQLATDVRWYTDAYAQNERYRCNFEEVEDDDGIFWQNMRRLKVDEEGSNSICHIVGRLHIPRAIGGVSPLAERFRFDPVSLEKRMAAKAAQRRASRYSWEKVYLFEPDAEVNLIGVDWLHFRNYSQAVDEERRRAFSSVVGF